MLMIWKFRAVKLPLSNNIPAKYFIFDENTSFVLISHVAAILIPDDAEISHLESVVNLSY